MKRVAIAYASCASAWFSAVPVRMMPSPMLSTLTLEVGMCFLIALVMMSTSRLTAISKRAICFPSASKKTMLVCSELVAVDVDAARRAHHDVGDLGIGNQHILDVARKIVDDRLADPESQEERGRVVADE